MQLLLKEFIFDMIRQLFGCSKPRGGKIITTPYTLQKMREHGLEAVLKLLNQCFQWHNRVDLIHNVKQIQNSKPHKSRVWRWPGL